MIKIFITGPPGIGKTTCVSKIYETLSVYGYKVVGFISKEIREEGKRVGFEIISLSDGQREILAHVKLKEGPRVGKYIVNKNKFDEFLDTIIDDIHYADVYIVDEIGPMELTSSKFLRLVDKILNNKTPSLMTIHITISKEIHKRFKTKYPNVLYRLTKENRDAMPLIIWKELNKYIGK